jgi:hypothetical protein
VYNEPVQLELSGTPATVLHVDKIVPLPGNGLISQVDTIAAKRDPLRRFVAATLRAMTDIAADPQKGLDAAVALVPDLGTDKVKQLAILKATIATWSSDYTKANGPGAIDRSAWTATVSYMVGLPESPVSSPAPTVDQLVDARLLKYEAAQPRSSAGGPLLHAMHPLLGLTQRVGQVAADRRAGPADREANGDRPSGQPSVTPSPDAFDEVDRLDLVGLRQEEPESHPVEAGDRICRARAPTEHVGDRRDQAVCSLGAESLL